MRGSLTMGKIDLKIWIGPNGSHFLSMDTLLGGNTVHEMTATESRNCYASLHCANAKHLNASNMNHMHLFSYPWLKLMHPSGWLTMTPLITDLESKHSRWCPLQPSFCLDWPCKSMQWNYVHYFLSVIHQWASRNQFSFRKLPLSVHHLAHYATSLIVFLCASCLNNDAS